MVNLGAISVVNISLVGYIFIKEASHISVVAVRTKHALVVCLFGHMILKKKEIRPGLWRRVVRSGKQSYEISTDVSVSLMPQ